ncbi:MAG: type II toxin-antitoxin system PemK/MazF family toxin [Deltaproteobacteria bacterium]|nr:type II toxin-antitoxin system PemK/MazF family toxin [Deltaproteobacteria bacterium]
MMVPERGEVWIVDLGLAAKIRPCLIFSVPAGEEDRSLVTLIPHTTSLRGSRFERKVAVPFLRPGAFNAQSIVTVPTAKLLRCVGKLRPEQITQVEEVVCGWLGLRKARG